ncbi:MAG: A/G-specific adenine glycosylase [Candidatus Korobacteraceae bacterium]|jgi:A/G-specific adenine glycosylase
MTSAQLRSLRRTLLRWYDQHRRDLPWRRNRDPYPVWVSEIMLQQTRVAAVLDHYARFLRRFPTVKSLAAARESSVLAMWSGLGYYHRARRMHQAAKLIARERRGKFPQTAEDWAYLPGIGRYTAAAIASISFGEAVAAVDGNVERVLQRLLGQEQSKATAWPQADILLDRERPGDFNQAMMELGATICTPRVSQCAICPLNPFCKSRGAEPPQPQAARERKSISYALARRVSSVLLVRRPADASLMAGMWELPTLAPGLTNGDTPLLRLRHSITDTDYRVAVFAVLPEQLHDFVTNGRWVTHQQSQRLPLTGLTRKVLRRLSLASNDGAGESICH